MPPYKRQHYLPAAYLRYFSTNQELCNRNSKVWRYDGKELRCVPVNSQCSDDYHYSKDNAAEVEKKFQRFEQIYCECVDKIKSGKPLQEKEWGSLMVLAFDFHIRNGIHKNLTGMDGFAAYNLRHQIFASQLLLRQAHGTATEGGLITHVEKYWRAQMFTPPNGHCFISSDHPSVWLSFNIKRPGVHLTLLPLNPGHLLVLFDRRIVNIYTEILTPEDIVTLNCAQIANSESCVFASESFTGESMDFIDHHLKDRPQLESVITDASWKVPVKTIAANHKLSFVSINPPLF